LRLKTEAKRITSALGENSAATGHLAGLIHKETIPIGLSGQGGWRGAQPADQAETT
jgi:hypothetical protein